MGMSHNYSNMLSPDTRAYNIFGGTRYNTTLDGNVSSIDSILQSIDNPNSTDFYDIVGGVADIPGNPLDRKNNSKIGLGCGFIQTEEGAKLDERPGAGIPYVLVDWIRIWQSLMYDINYESTAEHSLNFGWVDSINVGGKNRTGPDVLLGDFNYGTASASFRIENLTIDQVYSITLAMGDNNDAHSTELVVKDGGFEKTITASNIAGEFTTVTFSFTSETGTLNFNFSPNGDKWVINAIIIDEGYKKVQIGAEYG